MIVDRFWKTFWILFAATLLGGVTIALSLFIMYTRPGDLLAAVGVSYDPNKDPFENGTLANVAQDFSLNSGYLYQNALPVRFKSWSWSAIVDWRSGEQKSAGSYALKINSLLPGGSVGMNGPSVNISAFKSITMDVYADSSVGDVYIDLYGADGNSVGRQSLSWYASTTPLAPHAWQHITIPLENFVESSVHPPKIISGFSISTKNPGTAYIDEVRLVKDLSPHALWIAPPEVAGAAFNPFATSTPVSLPYTFSPAPDSLAKWFTYFGSFAPGANGEMQMGPTGGSSNTGSMTIFRGGLNWVDYRVETDIDWGEVSVFSVLVRFQSDGNFASCAFSHYGDGAQLYLMKDGHSQSIAQTPGLAIKAFEPWKDVKVGAQVQGNRVTCLVDGERVLSGELSGLSTSGTAGFETWDPNSFAAPHTLHAFSVSQLNGE